MPDIRLIATDIDDTLLRSDKTISERTRGVLRRLDERGIVLVPVTARPPRSLRAIADHCGFSGIALTCNGALVYDLAGDAILRSSPIAPAVARNIVTNLRATVPEICFGGQAGMDFGCESAYEVLRPISQQQGPWRADALDLARQPLHRLMALHPTLIGESLLPLVCEVVGDLAEATCSGLPLVEMSARGINKGVALAELCDSLGILPEQVVAFGDMLNDLPMLRWAGTGVAVANAHPAVLAVANAVTLSNDEDGLAVFVEGLLGLA